MLMILRARQQVFRFPRPVLIMGIVNVTPDSFSDGGAYFNPRQAVDHALALVEQGAEWLDIGGESTRPGARPVSEAEELRRVLPVIERLACRTSAVLSIDTMKPGVARAALAAGASLVNDVGANREDPGMWELVAEYRAGYVCMHAGGAGREPVPEQLHQPTGRSPELARQVARYFRARLKKMQTYGIVPEQVVFDPGIGFGKTLEQNLQLLAAGPKWQRLGRPLLLGVSRKSFIQKIFGVGLNERLPASLSCATLAVADGVHIIRTHDVTETVQAARMAEAILHWKKRV